MRLLSAGLAELLTGLTRILTGANARWSGCAPIPRQRIYFANHASHADVVLIWSALPPALRTVTQPVAGADYWMVSPLRRYVIQRIVRAVLVDRTGRLGLGDPIETMVQALDAGASLILFPEGTRNTTGTRLLPFKRGLYHLAQARPDVELIPTWIDNMARVLPKGAALPLPLLCSVSFGTPFTRTSLESQAAFLERAREALLALSTTARGH